MSLVEDIESYGLEGDISSGVGSFKRSGSLAMTSVDVSSIGMNGALTLVTLGTRISHICVIWDTSCVIW